VTAGRLVYVTGTPGTGVEKSLLKFANWRAAQGDVSHEKRPIVIKLEEHLRVLATDDVRNCLGAKVPSGETAHLYNVLLLPKVILSRRWQEAFDECLREAQSQMEQGRDAFLTFHASWYHLGNKENISGIDFGRLLRSDARADIVLTLIDDIYDVRSRLSAPGGVFDCQFSSDSELLDVVLKLMLSLDWRAFEITLSEQVAKAVGAKHFLFAVKHPLRTLGALLYEDRKLIYLSHHISELRRMSYRSVAEQSTARAMIKLVQAVARELRAETVLFEPTTIDEARFDYEVSIKGRKRVVPKLGARWPQASEDETELAWVRPDHEFSELGKAWQSKAGQILKQATDGELKPAQLAEMETASALIGTLREKIISQINSRDHFLVEHCDGIAVYRPFMLGHEAGGVKEEVTHHQRLIRGGIGRGTAILLHPSEDEEMRPRRMGQRCLDGWCKEREILGRQAAVARMLREAVSSETLWAEIRAGDPGATGRHLKEHLDKYGLKFKGAPEPGALGSALAIAEKEADERRGKQFCDWMKKNYLGELELGPRTAVVKDDLSPEHFAARVKRILTQN
jgi:hypothetical protein